MVVKKVKKIVTVKTDYGNLLCDSKDFDLSIGSLIILSDHNNSLIFGKVISTIKEYIENDLPANIYEIDRIATDDDLKNIEKNIKDSNIAIEKAQKLQNELNLSMKIIDSFYNFDRSQLTFIFTADGRIDFRELAKKLAQVYKTRIELRQIGVRDNAKRIGGIGPCGRFLCCSTFLNDFDSVSINMAKNQYIALNPTKINGVCGRLLCCLKYEDDQYSEMKKDFPKIGQTLEIGDVSGKVSSVNLFLKTVVLETKNKGFVEVKLEEDHGSN